MKTLLLATTAIIITGSVHAADAIVEEPVAVVVDGFTWSGVYVGIHGGYAWVDGDYDVRLLPGTAQLTSEFDLDGFLVGGHAGVQHQFDNNVVLGAEVDIDYRNGDGSALLLRDGGPILGNPALGAELNWTASARLRAGYAMDRWLPYITGGFAFADYDGTVFQNGVPLPPAVGTRFSETSVGWTLGIGTEYAFTDNLIFRAEYRYSDFGDESVAVLDAPVAGSSFELTSNDIILGLSYKF